jgi:hypothetical protein
MVQWNLAADWAIQGLIPTQDLPFRCHYYRPGTSDFRSDTDCRLAGPGLDYTGGWWRQM